MNPRQRTAFMKAADHVGAHALRKKNLSLKDFPDSQADVCENAEIGVNILKYFCEDDGCFNGFRDGVQIALTFLIDVDPRPPNQDELVRATRDLKELLARGDFHDLRNWADAHFFQ